MSGVPVLTYHSLHAPGDTYSENDHVALAEDLVNLHRAGYSVVPLREIVERLLHGDGTWFRDGCKVGISFDDGCNHDYIDFNFPGLPFVCHSGGVRDDFSRVDNAQDAAMQIEQAEAFIRQTVGEEHAIGLFAYPDGRSSGFLRSEYFPGQNRIRAAFGTSPGRVSGASDRWDLPRYVCGDHWSTPDELADLLRAKA